MLSMDEIAVQLGVIRDTIYNFRREVRANPLPKDSGTAKLWATRGLLKKALAPLPQVFGKFKMWADL